MGVQLIIAIYGMFKVAQFLNINVIDHYIIAEEGVLSMAEEREYNNIDVLLSENDEYLDSIIGGGEISQDDWDLEL